MHTHKRNTSPVYYGSWVKSMLKQFRVQFQHICVILISVAHL